MNRLRIVYLAIFLVYAGSSSAEVVQGSLTWGNTVALSFPVTGLIAELDAQPGSLVRQNQVLARLDKTPFDSLVKKAQANVDKFAPMIFDAQQDYNQARELYDRTLLSDVELQKSRIKIKGLEAEQAAAQADLELAQWHRQRSQLIAPFGAIITRSNLVQGLVVSEENQSELRIELARSGMMHVQLKVTTEALAGITIEHKAKVLIGNDSYSGIVKRIEIVPDASGMHIVLVEFSHPVERSYTVMQPAKVVF